MAFCGGEEIGMREGIVRASSHLAMLSLELKPIEKWSFYEAVNTKDHVLTIQTADQHLFANLLLSIGVRMA